jgi:DNA primase
MISRDTINQVLDRCSLLEIVSESVPLKRRGSNYLGLCPFHSEKSPSFNVRESDHYYHCFGCGASGNVIDFVMRQRGLSFPDAVEELAARAGIKVERVGAPRNDKFQESRQALYRINRVALSFFAQELERAPREVPEYLKERGVTADALRAFGVGFAPGKEWRALYGYLRERKISDDALISSGVVKRNSRGEMYDVFRSRIIFPVFVDERRIAGFGGRLVPGLTQPDREGPKYLNSPETAVYQKSKILFGLPQALETARRSGVLYLVEGYMDVIGLWQAGVRNTVATCGTAVTAEHVKRLSHLVRRVVVVFDGDAAGRSAAGKCFPTFLNSGIDVHALFLPEEDDPDTVALRHGEKTQKYLEELPKRALLDCYIDFIAAGLGGEVSELGAAAKGKLADQITGTLAQVSNAIERSELVQQAALRMRADPGRMLDMIEGGVKIGASGIAAESAPGNAPPEEPKNPAEILPVTSLPRVDREILRTVMTLKESLVDEVLRDPDICPGGVEPSTLLFIQGLAGVVMTDADPALKKEEITRLLKHFGPTWLAHWRESYDMMRDKDVDMRQAFDECRRAVRKQKLGGTLRQLDRAIGETPDLDARAALLQEKLTLERKVREL